VTGNQVFNRDLGPDVEMGTAHRHLTPHSGPTRIGDNNGSTTRRDRHPVSASGHGPQAMDQPQAISASRLGASIAFGEAVCQGSVRPAVTATVT
jgi:hypothetical protein